jgi:uncharacterized cupin superfamily protein
MATIPIAAGAAPTTEYRPDAERIVAGDPVQTVVNVYDSGDGKFSTGLWSGEPGTWRVAYTEDETCHLLEGEVVLRGDDGGVATYRAGDSFVVPAGFTGTWEVVRRARKLYAIYQP